jgi:hypothetical protein
MDSQSQGVSLNQVARLLFDQAAARWQLSLGLQFAAGILGLIITVVAPSVAVAAAWALVIMIVLVASYWIRFTYEARYDIAETMRRQAVLSEGLGWPIARAQFNEWKSRAGKKMLARAREAPRPNDYYESAEKTGPKRLAEMTFESLFWTKSLYRKVQQYLSAFLALAALVLILLLLSAPLFVANSTTLTYVVYAVYLFVPVLISVDAIGVLVKLHRAIDALCEIEPHIESLAGDPNPDIAEVMRLVAEYNCVVSAGVPIPKWLFNRHHDEIQAYWGEG